MPKTPDQITPTFAPIYMAGMYPGLCKLFQEHGYALAVHGSVARDFDLIAVPWVARPHSHRTVIRAIMKKYAVKFPTKPKKMKHGRIAYSVSLSYGDCYLDISFFPKPNART